MKTVNDKILIRRATAADATLIAVLASTTFYEAYFEQDESANLARYIAESFDIETIAAELADPRSTFFIISLNEKAVGYARLIAGSTTDGVSAGGVIELKRIYILERLWGKSVGEALLDHCIGAAVERGFAVIWLGVWDENLRAQRFYAKFGFREVGKISVPYGDVVGVNLVLEKLL